MSIGAEKGKNIKSAASFIEKACLEGTKIICLPELFMTRYFCQSENTSNFDHADLVTSDSINIFKTLAGI